MPYIPGSKCGVWCTHGDLPCVLMRAQCLAAGWQWWLLWGRATPETPESSVGRPAPHLCDEARGSNRCGREDTFFFIPLLHIFLFFFYIRHAVYALIQSEEKDKMSNSKGNLVPWKCSLECLKSVKETYGRDLMILQHSLRSRSGAAICLPTNLTLWMDVVACLWCA